MIPGELLNLGSNSCRLALRKNIIDGDNRIYIGNIFLKENYVFLDQKDNGELFVGIGPQNPEDIIGEAHYNPDSNRTDYLPEDRDTDMSINTGDRDPYDTDKYAKGNAERKKMNAEDIGSQTIQWIKDH